MKKLSKIHRKKMVTNDNKNKTCCCNKMEKITNEFLDLQDPKELGKTTQFSETKYKQEFVLNIHKNERKITPLIYFM